jgi:ABC-2 type transport system permease protein
VSDPSPTASHPLEAEAEDRRTAAQKRAQKRSEAKVNRYKRMAEKKADSMPVIEAPDGPKQARLVDADLVSPAPKGGLMDVFSQRYLLRLIVRRELAQMYSASILGLLWSYIQPAVRFAMYFFVMGVVLHAHRTVPDFAIHLFCGMVFVHYFTETFNGGTRSIVANRALVKKMAMPREMFPVASSVVALYHTVPQIVLLMVICIFSGWHVTMGGIAAGLLGFAIIMTFGTALALLFSSANVFFRDFQNIVATITYFVHFMVPMMYAYSQVKHSLQGHNFWLQVYLADPIAIATLLVQRLFWYGVAQNSPDAQTLVGRQALQFPPHIMYRGAITLVICVVLLYLCQRVFARLENKFPERL